MTEKEEVLSDKDADAWLDMVDQSRVEAMVILHNISKGFVQEKEINKLQVLIPICFDAIALLGPKRWQKLLDLHSEQKQ
jgi:hypothetical protein